MKNHSALEIVLIKNFFSTGSRLTTAEAWIEHLEVKIFLCQIFKTFLTKSLFQALHPRTDDSTNEKPLDVISELDETILDDEKLPRSYSRGDLQREKDDMLKVKKVCCRSIKS